jgi:hypothetical protein
LSQREADYMFHHSRTPEQLEEAVYKFAEGFTISADWRSFVKQES